jgi:hypothetical protein
MIPLPDQHPEIAVFLTVKFVMVSGYSKAFIAEVLGLPMPKVVDYYYLSLLPESLITLWIEQKRHRSRKPFLISTAVIRELYAAVLHDHKGTTINSDGREINSGLEPNFDPNGGPEYQATFNKLNKH